MRLTFSFATGRALNVDFNNRPLSLQKLPFALRWNQCMSFIFNYKSYWHQMCFSKLQFDTRHDSELIIVVTEIKTHASCRTLRNNWWVFPKNGCHLNFKMAAIYRGRRPTYLKRTQRPIRIPKKCTLPYIRWSYGPEKGQNIKIHI